MWRRSSGIAMAVMTVGVVACASAGSTQRPANALAGEMGATVEVTNNNWSDMAVYGHRSGVRVRLGMVTSMTTAKFDLPVALMAGSGAMFFVADPIGSGQTYRSPVVMVGRGQRIEFNLENNLSLSSLTVW